MAQVAAVPPGGFVPSGGFVPPGGSVVARLAANLIGELDRLTEQLVVRLRETDESYLPVDVADLRRAVHANLRSFLTDLATQSSPSTSSSRETARRRAAQGVPLGSVLHAYRLGFQVIWAALADRALREGQSCLDGLVRESTMVWAWVDTSSEAVNVEYHEALIDSARHDEQQRMLLLEALLEGRLGEWKLLGGSLHAIGLPERGPYLAVSAETGETGLENLRAVDQYLRRNRVASAWLLRPDEKAGLIAVKQALPFPAIRELLAKEATARVGISPEFDDALDAGRSLQMAAVACHCLPPGSAGVATIDDDPLATVVASAPDISGHVVRHLLGRVNDLAPAERELLLGTLRTWMDCGGNTSAAARELYCHRNTVRNRLQRVEELSGQSLSDPRGIAGLSIAARGARLLGGKLTGDLAARRGHQQDRC